LENTWNNKNLFKKVQTYTDFITYLLNKNKDFQIDTLDMMGGKNQVIYWIPKHLNDFFTTT